MRNKDEKGLAELKPISLTEEERRKYPIPPDGYVPNSAIRKAFSWNDISQLEKEDKSEIWQPPPLPPLSDFEKDYLRSKHVTIEKKTAAAKIVETAIAVEPIGRSNSEITTEDVDLDFADQDIIKNTPTPNLSKESTRVSVEKSTKYTREYDDEELEAIWKERRKKVLEERANRKKLPLYKPPSPRTLRLREIDRILEKYKGKNLTLPKVQLGDDLWGKGTKSGKRDSINEDKKSELPEIFQRILKERWFMRNVPNNPESIIRAMIEITRNCNDHSHKAICNYLIEINENFGYPPELLQLILTELTDQLNHPSHERKQNTIKVLEAFGMERKLALAEVLPKTPSSTNSNVSTEIPSKKTSQTLNSVDKNQSMDGKKSINSTDKTLKKGREIASSLKNDISLPKINNKKNGISLMQGTAEKKRLDPINADQENYKDSPTKLKDKNKRYNKKSSLVVSQENEAKHSLMNKKKEKKRKGWKKIKEILGNSTKLDEILESIDFKTGDEKILLEEILTKLSEGDEKNMDDLGLIEDMPELLKNPQQLQEVMEKIKERKSTKKIKNHKKDEDVLNDTLTTNSTDSSKSTFKLSNSTSQKNLHLNSREQNNNERDFYLSESSSDFNEGYSNSDDLPNLNFIESPNAHLTVDLKSVLSKSVYIDTQLDESYISQESIEITSESEDLELKRCKGTKSSKRTDRERYSVNSLSVKREKIISPESIILHNIDLHPLPEVGKFHRQTANIEEDIQHKGLTVSILSPPPTILCQENDQTKITSNCEKKSDNEPLKLNIKETIENERYITELTESNVLEETFQKESKTANSGSKKVKSKAEKRVNNTSTFNLSERQTPLDRDETSNSLNVLQVDITTTPMKNLTEEEKAAELPMLNNDEKIENSISPLKSEGINMSTPSPSVLHCYDTNLKTDYPQGFEVIKIHQILKCVILNSLIRIKIDIKDNTDHKIEDKVSIEERKDKMTNATKRIDQIYDNQIKPVDVFIETDWKKSLASLSNFKVIKSEVPPYKPRQITPREGELPDIKNADMGMRYLKKVEFENIQEVEVKKHVVESMPGRHGIHANTEEGTSKYGLLALHWRSGKVNQEGVSPRGPKGKVPSQLETSRKLEKKLPDLKEQQDSISLFDSIDFHLTQSNLLELEDPESKLPSIHNFPSSKAKNPDNWQNSNLPTSCTERKQKKIKLHHTKYSWDDTTPVIKRVKSFSQKDKHGYSHDCNYKKLLRKNMQAFISVRNE
ncbi:DgyrCDS8692 [Dimorphilus gyrociliatus]|uniref:DgyrCDS8692 n=1 Tax=Dimorphilus gyrociliatus TaxID=2664684 RepID=A0A7I8W020_9ANNE|nr:DgyrCDS8692 [Dimorphilus gyrociliatus]